MRAAAMTVAVALLPALLALLVVMAEPAAAYSSDRVLLQDLRTITLRRGAFTTGRRSAPVPQLACIGGSAGCDAGSFVTMQCHQQTNEQWECKADLPNGVSFGETTVVCEGYDSPNDPYVLAGSCGVEYTLEGRADTYRNNQNPPYYHNTNYSSSRSSSSVWSLITFGFIAYVIYRVCWGGSTGTTTGQPGVGGGGGGWGGWGGWGGNGGGGGGGGTYPNCGPSTSTSTGGPGFWTGLGVGGLLGNFFARPAGNRYGHNAGYAAPPAYGGGGFFGGGGGMGGGMGGGGGGGGGTRQATGFGGTRRR